MKNRYFSLFLFCFSLVSFGQIVNIPDANFKNKLVNTNCASLQAGGSYNTDVDTNNNGEIEENEASQILRLNLDNSNIATLEGLQSFTNLQELFVNGNNLTSVDFSTLNSLRSIQCSYNELTSIVLGQNVIYFEAEGNQLTNADFIAAAPNLIALILSTNLLTNLNAVGVLVNLRYLDVSSNLIASIDTSTLTLLESLYIDHNNLTSLTIPNSCTVLHCAYNQIASIDLTGLQLFGLNVSYNQLTSLEIPSTCNFEKGALSISGNLYTSVTLPTTTIGSFQCNDTRLISLKVPRDTGPYDLEPFQIQNNLYLQNLDATISGLCIYNPDWVCMQQITGNSALEFICVNEVYLQQSNAPTLEYIASLNNPNLFFTSYCSFTPVANYNTLSGNIKIDIDGGGCSDTDTPAPSIPVKIERFGQNVGSVFTYANGNYTTFSTSFGQTTLTPQFENPYYIVTPASYTSSFVDFGNTETVNFCITPNGVHNDLEAGLIAITPALSGFDATYKIIYKNKGTTTQSGNVTFNFNDFYSDFVSATVVPSTQSGDWISWAYTNLAPFETREITIILNVNSPLESPAVNPGDLLILGAQVSSSATDETYLDNYANLTQVVVGSIDPNDKQVSALAFYYEYADVVDLYYTIRFQNLGTFAAENIVVADILSNKLNDSKLQMVSSSHPYMSRYNTQTRKLEFIFEGINLPAAIDDEPGSHGYVSFKINPVSTITLGQTIENNASIYFDFNAPVLTNTTSTIIETLLQTDSFNNATFTLHPNPVKNTINIDVASGVIIQSISIYNPLGQLVKTLTVSEVTTSSSIDVSSLKTGTYFMEIASNNGKTTKKFVKL